jgi:nitronate monooxygenase/enoyl-[acyl-carrier protein] reductase II
VLRTPFCELLDIEAPILQAAIWPATSPELVAAVSEAGAIGTIAGIFSTADSITEQIERVRAVTDRPFVVNHVVPTLDDDAFQATLEARPAAVSLALGDPGGLVERAHAAGAKVIQQVHNVEQAREAAALGVDVVIAQGSEAGGQGMAGGPGLMALVPQVVDSVAPTPVLAAGGIADGRGLAAALVLGAAGANVGTRFLASEEASTHESWKRRIVEAESEQTVRFETWGAIMPPPPPGAYEVVPRVIRTEFVGEWESRAGDAAAEAERLRGEIMDAVTGGRMHELVPFSGQSVGLIRDVRPAAKIVKSLVAEAERALECS